MNSKSNGIMSKLENVFVPLAEKIGSNPVLMSVRDGFLVSTPLLIVGSIFLLIANFPIPAFTQWMSSVVINPTTGATLAQYIAKPADATFTIMAVYGALGIAYYWSVHLKIRPIFGAATALMAWFILMPYGVTGDATINGVTESVTLGGGVSTGWLGARGIFIGIFCAFIAPKIFQWVENQGWVIKMPEGVPPTVSNSFSSLIPMLFVMVVFFIINLIFGFFGTDAFTFVYDVLQVPLLRVGDTLGSMVFAYIILHFLWFFGVNGGSVVGAVYNPILQTLSLENIDFFTNGVGEPNIITQQFQDLFATFGGAGSTLSLVVLMILVAKSARLKDLGKLSIGAGIFNINEPIIFGLPVVLNPIMIIPFMLVPTANIVITYFAMNAGLVPLTSGISVPWTTPVIISGLLTTGWRGALLQAFLLVVNGLIYYPFIRIIDRQYLNEEMTVGDKSDDDEDDFDLADVTFD